MSKASINSPAYVAAFKAEAAVLGLCFDDPRSADTNSKRLQLRNDAKKVGNAIAARAWSEGRDVTDAELGAICEVTSRVAYLDGMIDANGRAASGNFPAGSEFSPPPGINAAQWAQMIGAPGASAALDDDEQLIDVHSGKRIPVITAQNASRAREIMGVAPRNRSQAGIVDTLRGWYGGNPRADLGESSGSGQVVVTPTYLFPDVAAFLGANLACTQAGARFLILGNDAAAYKIATVTGLPTASWRAEAATVNESDPTLTAVTLVPKSLSVMVKVSRELVMDSPNAEPTIIRTIGQAFALAIDYAALRGPGTGNSPTGLGVIGGVSSYSMGTNGAAATSYDYSVNALKNLLTQNAQGKYAWITNPAQLAVLGLLKDSQQRALSRPPMVDQYIGDRVFNSSQLAQNETQGSSNLAHTAYFGDFRDLWIGVRSDLMIQRADQLYGATGQIAFLAHSRVDVAVVRPGSFTKVVGLL